MTSDEETSSEAIFELSLGSRCPYSRILESGTLPEGWEADYLEQLAMVSKVWSGRTEIPRKIAAAIHAASLYLPLRYDGWRHLNPGLPRNSDTESAIGRIRTSSEFFFMGSLGKLRDSSV